MYNIEDIQADCIALTFPELYELRVRGEKKHLAIVCVINRKLTIEVPDLDGEIIYEARIGGLHNFLPSERKYWLEGCKKILIEYLNPKKEKRDEEDGLQRDEEE